MLAKLNCGYVTVGHSERRQYHHEDDALVNAKASGAVSGGVMPIICVGEGLDVRQAGEHVAALPGARSTARWPSLTDEQVASLVDRVRAGLGHRHRRGRDAGGRPGGVRAIRRLDRASASPPRPPSRSGCSTAARSSPSNVAAIMAQPDVDGCLVGGASLVVDEFSAIARFYDLPAL